MEKDNENTRVIELEVSLEEAQEMYKSGNSYLKNIALNAYSEEELNTPNNDNYVYCIERTIYSRLSTSGEDESYSTILTYTFTKDRKKLEDMLNNDTKFKSRSAYYPNLNTNKSTYTPSTTEYYTIKKYSLI